MLFQIIESQGAAGCCCESPAALHSPGVVESDRICERPIQPLSQPSWGSPPYPCVQRVPRCFLLNPPPPMPCCPLHRTHAAIPVVEHCSNMPKLPWGSGCCPGPLPSDCRQAQPWARGLTRRDAPRPVFRPHLALGGFRDGLPQWACLRVRAWATTPCRARNAVAALSKPSLSLRVPCSQAVNMVPFVTSMRVGAWSTRHTGPDRPGPKGSEGSTAGTKLRAPLATGPGFRKAQLLLRTMENLPALLFMNTHIHTCTRTHMHVCAHTWHNLCTHMCGSHCSQWVLLGAEHFCKSLPAPQSTRTDAFQGMQG
ncbi:cyclic AMP-dependent transcription factor ATF-6 beta [Platysternon megacephalum]|uniref:Cyclic AMP-dependent transcription factor ATF-6 beta n=1 Tax=Platysternon megacephalum TaxID=55544 RepID=A0A4D9DJP2_9SAUR|nr:cyclic AMP-dependent transcription factor ATF-6 beta [Platysternon megacephalum]